MHLYSSGTSANRVSIVDDGFGMNKEQLSNAFVLGYSSTY